MGNRFFLGYDQQGQMQYRTLSELKTLAGRLAVGGKARSLAYLVASSVLADNTRAYVIGPHPHQPESLSSLLQPLVHTSRVSIINPFHTPKLLNSACGAETTNKRRDHVNESILLVIDEFAGLAGMDYFNLLLAFLKQCAEEGQAKMAFIGSSEKWTTRHFTEGKIFGTICVPCLFIRRNLHKRNCCLKMLRINYW